MWRSFCGLFVLPVDLEYSESSVCNIPFISIISAFPIGIIIIWSLFKDMKKYVNGKPDVLKYHLLSFGDFKEKCDIILRTFEN